MKGEQVSADKNKRKPLVLVGEDDPADRNLIQRCLADADVELKLLADGEAMLQYLSQAAPESSDEKKPDLIILDLNMPRLNGEMILKHIRLTRGIHRVPVVVLSSSNSRLDIAACYESGCTSYIVKPTDLEPFMDAINQVTRYWLTLVESPDTGARA